MSQTLDPVKVPQQQKSPPPPSFNIVMHNDDDTTFDLVLYILTTVFGRTPEQAAQIALEAHQKDKAIVTTYPSSDMAHTKVSQAHAIARKAETPLLFTAEPA